MPSTQTVEVTGNVTLVASVTGTGVKSFNYQWRHNRRIIQGKYSDILFIFNATESDSGDYICIASNSYVNRVTSNTVQLLVTSTFIYTYVAM